MNQQRKKQKLICEFNEGIVKYHLKKAGIDASKDLRDIIMEARAQCSASEKILIGEIWGQYEWIMGQFETFKERKPEQMDIHIGKFSSQSLKVIYRKYLSYIRYLVFQRCKDNRDYHLRF